jgi:hypothetical protein
MRGTPVLALALLASAFAAPQTKKRDEGVCPWCKNEPALMKAAGVESHGPIAIAHASDAIVAQLAASQWVFVETAHLRIATCMGEDSVDQSDKGRVEAELARLRAVLPDVPAKVKRLDPWLRAHLLAMKCEELYARFQFLLRVTDADFPESRQPDGPYMGNGRFLGEKDKFEIVLHTTRASHVRFTESFSGVAVPDSFRWHFPSVHKLLVSVPAEDADLREDRWLFPHVAHNLSHLFFCAYKHFSYDPPAWLDEGLAQALEKEIEPESRTTEGEEGSLRDTKGPSDYFAAAKRLAASRDAPALAQLMHAKDFGSLGDEGSIVAWAIVRMLADEHGEAFARFLGGVKGQLDDKGYPSGADLSGLQRRLFKELWGWTPADVDAQWKDWIARHGARK